MQYTNSHVQYARGTTYTNRLDLEVNVCLMFTLSLLYLT